MKRRPELLLFAGWVAGVLGGAQAISAAEIIALSIPGGTVRGEVIKVTKSEVVIKEGGKDRSIPAALLKPKDIYLCSKQILDPKDAKAAFELGEFCLKHSLKDSAELELRTAARLDAASYGEKVKKLLAPQAPEIKTVEPVKALEVVALPEKEVPKVPKVAEVTEVGKEPKSTGMSEGDDFVEVTGPDGKKYKLSRRFKASHVETKPKTPEEVKTFIAERTAELNKMCGKNWRMDETKHYYFFSNLKPELHELFKQETEKFYGDIAGVMQHKEGDPLWHNKCPIYFFSTRQQFVNFATGIDGSAGGANSGGYFSHRGREVHIAIPLIDWLPESHQKREALNTLHHEGTHAFIQLTGKDVDINPWLHEGMAQFMEFYYDPKNNTGRNDRVNTLRELLRRGDLLSWEEGRMRPMGGGDSVGYAFAWSRVWFLYQNFETWKLPRLIKTIKEGKSDEVALETVYGMKLADLDKRWEFWLKEASKTNFKP